MGTSAETKEQLINTLQTLPVCKPNSTKVQWVVRCPYCGDSKNPNHGHFSIKIDIDSNDAIVYRCLRCGESGLLTPQVLEDISIYDPKLEKALEYLNLIASKSSSKNHKDKKYDIPVPNDNISNKRKLAYINNRLDISISYEECEEYGIILNLSEFLITNSISIVNEKTGLDLKPYTIKELNDKYVGFISSNRNKITFRDTTDTGFFGRYYKITFDLYHNSMNNFYSLINSFELLYNEDIHVHVSEGTFDILSVYMNFHKDDNLQNNLFFASCGFNYNTIIKYLVYMGVTTNIILHVYSDNDKSDNDLLRVFNDSFIQIWVDEIIVHRNTFPKEKDFGVPKSRINEVSYKLRTI